MNTIVIYMADETLMDTLEGLNIGAKVHKLTDGIGLESESGYAIIRHDANINSEMDEEERNSIESIIGSQFDCYSVTFRDFALVEDILKSIADRRVVIDNDHGLVVPIKEFIELIKRVPWDSLPEDI